MDPFNAWAHYFKGYALLAADRLDEAKRAAAEFDDMLERSRSPDATCWRQLFRAEERLAAGRPAEALTEASGIPFDRCPYEKQSVAYLNARAHVAAGNSSQALAAYREVVDPPYPQGALEFGPRIPTLYQLARLEEETGDRLAAREHYRRFLDHWGDADRALPEVADAKQRLARLN